MFSSTLSMCRVKLECFRFKCLRFGDCARWLFLEEKPTRHRGLCKEQNRKRCSGSFTADMDILQKIPRCSYRTSGGTLVQYGSDGIAVIPQTNYTFLVARERSMRHTGKRRLFATGSTGIASQSAIGRPLNAASRLALRLVYCNTSIPLISGLSAPPLVKAITICPELLAVVLNCSVSAWFCTPAVAKMSKLLRTWVPLIATLKTRCPAAVQLSSAKCKRTA